MGVFFVSSNLSVVIKLFESKLLGNVFFHLTYYINMSLGGSDSVMPPGIYSLDDLKEFGTEKGWCPYFLARHVISHTNILVYNYQYMLDPKVAALVSRELEVGKKLVTFYFEKKNTPQNSNSHNDVIVCYDRVGGKCCRLR